MTIEVHLEEIVESIADISIAGINVRGLDKIPENAMSILPVFAPRPDDFITEMQWTRETFGTDATAGMNLSYTLNYRYLHSVIGSGGGLLANYSGLIRNLAKILEAVFANSTPDGSVDVSLQGISNIAPLSDAAGETDYHGVDIAFRVLEFVQ